MSVIPTSMHKGIFVFFLCLIWIFIVLKCMNGHVLKGYTPIHALRRTESSFYARWVKMAKFGRQTIVQVGGLCPCVCAFKFKIG